ncbi:MAG: GTP-binding protein [Blastopirellula sp.]|nr:GTP-binding protein [Blastopirellula sp.]
MGQIRPHPPVLLIIGAFSRYDDVLDWAAEATQRIWGTICLSSPRFNFDQTTFYERSMGQGLRKTFWAFEPLIDPAEIAQIKLQTNELEAACPQQTTLPEERPLNLDPGYISEAKLVLATTKDRDHRIYLQKGIYCEGTLFYHKGQWRSRPWTYPDYQTSEYHRFFDQCRAHLRKRYHGN